MRPESPLDELWLTGFADLYRAFSGVMSPSEVNECELWELAALLGVDRRNASTDPIDRIAARIETEKESLARRASKLSNSQPDVEASDGPVDMTAQIMRQMGVVTR